MTSGWQVKTKPLEESFQFFCSGVYKALGQSHGFPWLSTNHISRLILLSLFFFGCQFSFSCMVVLILRIKLFQNCTETTAVYQHFTIFLEINTDTRFFPCGLTDLSCGNMQVFYRPLAWERTIMDSSHNDLLITWCYPCNTNNYVLHHLLLSHVKELHLILIFFLFCQFEIFFFSKFYLYIFWIIIIIETLYS